MEVIALRDPATGSTARLAVGCGFNCCQFTAMVGDRAIDVLAADSAFPSPEHSPSGHGLPILFPFPNRIRDGKYIWDGRNYQIPRDGAQFDAHGNAIHGFCLDRPWRLLDAGDQSALAEFQLSVDAPELVSAWPSDFRISIRYQVREACLRADIEIHNPGKVPLPWGLGTHPYFRVPLSPDSSPANCLIQAAATCEWVLSDCLPNGRQRPIRPEKDLREGAYFDQLDMDDVLSGLPTDEPFHESLIIDERAGLQVSQICDVVFGELVVYTPADRRAVCLEPYTCITDAVNLRVAGVDTGWRVLKPGSRFRTWFEIRAGKVIV